MRPHAHLGAPMSSWLTDLITADVPWALAILIVIIWIGYKSVPFIATFVRLVDDLVNTDEKLGVDVRIYVMTKDVKGNTARLGAIEEQMKTVHHELTTNYGSSVKDATKRLENQGAKTEKLRADHITETAHWAPMLSALHRVWSDELAKTNPRPTSSLCRTVRAFLMPETRKEHTMSDRNPIEPIDQDDYEVPDPEEATDLNHPDYVAPTKGIKPLGGK